MHPDTWYYIGLLGTLLFSGRWVIQFFASHKVGKPVFTRNFWYVSIAGSLCILSYFIFGNRDTVGIISNLFPLLVALYNLYLINKKPL